MRTGFKERYERETCVPGGQCGEWPDAEHLAVKFKEHNAPCLPGTDTARHTCHCYLLTQTGL